MFQECKKEARVKLKVTIWGPLRPKLWAPWPDYLKDLRIGNEVTSWLSPCCHCSLCYSVCFWLLDVCLRAYICNTKKHFLLSFTQLQPVLHIAQMLAGKATELSVSTAWQALSVNSSSKFLCAIAAGRHNTPRLNMGMHHSDVPCVSVLWGQYESWRHSPD